MTSHLLSILLLFLLFRLSSPGLVAGPTVSKIKEQLIIDHWEEILRTTVTMTLGAMLPGQLLRKFAAYPRQGDFVIPPKNRSSYK